MSSLLDALIQTESSGNPQAVGPPTKWGRALGSTQMLPATAQEMAQKLGLPWRPDLLTAPSEEGKNYQRRLGEAYLNEGLEKTGNVRDALKYYHGGPNRRLWGPKTNAYAEKVLAQAGTGNDQMPSYGLPQMPVPPTVGMNENPQQPEPQGLAGILQQPQPNYAAMSPESVNGRDPLAPKPKFFGKGGDGWSILGIIFDALAASNGVQPQYGPEQARRREREDERNERVQRFYAEQEEKRRERMTPKHLGGGKFGYIGDDGKPVITGELPQEQEMTNAARELMEMGYQPGTPDFVEAMRARIYRPVVIDGQPYGVNMPPPPSQGAPAEPQSRVLSNGQRAWLIGGKWYDNPEGR